MEVNAYPVQLRGVVPTPGGTAVFLTTDAKTFVIYIEPGAGNVLRATLDRERFSRPLTHELMGRILGGFDIKLEHVVIFHVEENIFHARMVLRMRNELGTKILEVDSRPSDALTLAAQTRRPLYVTADVLEKVDDMSEILERILKAK
ncbi:MAG: bifunctional nuclease family protein [Puniceicoccales bacterium]|jgi:bifunctional DNase/RNase|nr:bifunctional nuclease family protein [Puniceicoccales bacterium]